MGSKPLDASLQGQSLGYPGQASDYSGTCYQERQHIDATDRETRGTTLQRGLLWPWQCLPQVLSLAQEMKMPWQQILDSPLTNTASSPNTADLSSTFTVCPESDYFCFFFW